MKKANKMLVAAATLAISGAAAAVVVNPRGQGQALIFPYYTTAAGNTSLITINNHSNQAKVVHVRWAEGEGGRTALALRVYLGQFDSWTGAVVDRGDGAAPALISTDRSCTHPEIVRSTTLPQLPDGRRYLPFGPLPADAGSATPERLREGYVEAVEVASIRAQTAIYGAVTPAQGEPRNCAAIAAAWTVPGGYWSGDSLRDLANPTGGLSGEIAIVDVAAGVIFAASALALEDYRTDPADQPRGTLASVALHAQVRDDLSLLGHALNDPVTQTAYANVVSDGRPLTLSYAAPARAIDAVSAVLAAVELSGPFEESVALGARTSFVLTYPTRAMYTHAAMSGSVDAIAPFHEAFGGLRPLTEGGTLLRLVDREALFEVWSNPWGGCGFPCPPSRAARLPGSAVEVLAIGGAPDPLLGTRLHGDIGIVGNGGMSLPQQGAGFLWLNLIQPFDGLAALLRPSREGYRLRGLPVLGLRLINYVNANAQPGVLANYSSALPMTAAARCVTEGGAVCLP